jgi:hypothetical protein
MFLLSLLDKVIVEINAFNDIVKHNNLVAIFNLKLGANQIMTQNLIHSIGED